MQVESLTRTRKRGLVGAAWVFILLMLVLPRLAYAYVDPGAGALIWQALLAAFFGFMFYARRIIRFVRDRVSREKDAGPAKGE